MGVDYLKGCERMDGLKALLDAAGKSALLDAAGKSETRKMVIDGKTEDMISSYGVIYAAYHGWKRYKIPGCERAVKRFCQYISLHGCTGGATGLFNALNDMTDDDAIQWLKESIDKYVTDKVAMVKYSLGV